MSFRVMSCHVIFSNFVMLNSSFVTFVSSLTVNTTVIISAIFIFIILYIITEVSLGFGGFDQYDIIIFCLHLLIGLLYVDLAFDVQRSVWLELLMCLLPPSGAALVIREVRKRLKIVFPPFCLTVSCYLFFSSYSSPVVISLSSQCYSIAASLLFQYCSWRDLPTAKCFYFLSM